MSKNADNTAKRKPRTLSRRRILQTAGAAAASTTLKAFGVPFISHGNAATGLRKKPNLLIILTDQERYPRHWPEGWYESNLPHRKRLADKGLNFSNMYCNSCMCTPSRGTFFTGVYPAQHGLFYTLTSGGSLSVKEPELSVSIQNMARMLSSAGYNVHYRGKWHLSRSKEGGKPTVEDVTKYGFQGWVAPDAGENTDPEGFGGGEANHDEAYANQAADFLRTQTPQSTADQPFALIVSFVNPHDMLAYPRTVDQDEVYAADSAKYNQGIKLEDIPTLNEDLANNNKPSVQAQSQTFLNFGLGPLLPPPSLDRLNYVNFYAYLHKVVDQHIGTVIDALEEQDLLESTVVIRTSDHGEMGLAHGGLRQKLFNAYQETIHIPLTISNPILFPEPKTTDSLASLVDIMPTLATLAEVPNRQNWVFKGKDLTPIINDPSAKVQDSLLFTFDDENAGYPEPQPFVTQPSHIRSIYDGRWKFARYFDPTGNEAEQYELYDHQTDPEETTNLANTNSAKREEMAQKLAALEAEKLGPMYQQFLPGIQRNS
jgi:choline-sulfatase